MRVAIVIVCVQYGVVEPELRATVSSVLVEHEYRDDNGDIIIPPLTRDELQRNALVCHTHTRSMLACGGSCFTPFIHVLEGRLVNEWV